MIKYYFAYHMVNGLCFPFRWSETDGIPEGGNFRLTALQTREISHHEYNYETLAATVRRYPFVVHQTLATE